MPDLNQLLRMLVDRSGSDLHIRVGEPPIIRIHGDLVRTEFPRLTAEDTYDLVHSIMNEDRRASFEERMELDMSYATDFARFRVNVFRQQGNIGSVMRVIPIAIKTIDELMLPVITKELAMRPRGLLLVTGPTGSGKSTTLAAIIDHINTNKQGHIITIEDPIEFTHQDKLCAINQRELGEDTNSFAAALKHVMRQNPDVILVGEMRDLETIQLAITAAETGHLVFSTVHTIDASQTIDRIVDVFPPEQQRQIRTQLSITLLGIVSQTLLPRADIPGRIAAFEVLVATPAIRSLIRDGKTHQIASDIQTGMQHGMVALDAYLLDLLRQRLVKYEDALSKSSNPRDFEQRAGMVRA
ncbi:MAG: type IV pilus twitching motility protein PilT [Capsulimonadaceae bacterium]